VDAAGENRGADLIVETAGEVLVLLTSHLSPRWASVVVVGASGAHDGGRWGPEGRRSPSIRRKRSTTMQRWHTFLVVAAALAIVGCGAAAQASSAISTSPATSTVPTTQASPSLVTIDATSDATSTPCPAAPTPLPSLASTTAKASDAPAGAIPIRMTATDGPRFEPAQITTKAGNVVFFLQNVPGPVFRPDHNMVIGPPCVQFDQDGTVIGQVLAKTPRLQADEAVSFTVNNLAPGTYVFWCSVFLDDGVGSHASNGMVGTLTVTP
jgi:plastocyanin